MFVAVTLARLAVVGAGAALVRRLTSVHRALGVEGVVFVVFVLNNVLILARAVFILVRRVLGTLFIVSERLRQVVLGVLLRLRLLRGHLLRGLSFVSRWHCFRLRRLVLSRLWHRLLVLSGQLLGLWILAVLFELLLGIQSLL